MGIKFDRQIAAFEGACLVAGNIHNFCGATYRTRLDDAFNAIRCEYEAACQADDAEMRRAPSSHAAPDAGSYSDGVDRDRKAGIYRDTVISCHCFNERDKELCLDKHQCRSFTACSAATLPASDGAGRDAQ